MMHPFDEAIRLEPLGIGRYSGRTSPSFANMVGPFGGITNALMLRAALMHPERLGAPVALTVNFAGPISDGEFEIHAAASRTSRSTQHWVVSLQQEGTVQATATAVFATRRAGWSDAESGAAPSDVPQPGELHRTPTKGLPAWCNRYDLRFIDGGLDRARGEGQASSLTRLWVRDDPPRPLSFESLASIVDCFFPRVFLRLGRMVPAGTVSVTTYFHADDATLQAQSDRFLYGVARGLDFSNGYFDQTAEVWGVDAHPLARSHQLVYYKA